MNRSFSDTKQLSTVSRRSWLFAFGGCTTSNFDPCVFFFQNRFGNDHADFKATVTRVGDFEALSQFLVRSQKVKSVQDHSRQQVRIASRFNFCFAKHTRNDDLNVLVIDLYTLATVYALDLTKQVMLHRFFTRNQQDIVRHQRPVNQLLTRSHIVARVNAESFSRWHQVLLLDSGLGVFDHDGTLTTLLLFENFYLTVDVGQNSGVFWLSSFKDLGYTWQTTCNIGDTGRFTRRFRDRCTGRYSLAILNQNMSPLRQVINIASDRRIFGVFQNQLGMSIATEVDHTSSHLTACIGFFFNCFAINNVFEANFTFDFAQQWNRKRVPVAKHVTGFDFAFIGDIQNRTRWNFVRLQLTTTWIKDRDLTRSVQNN